MSAEIKKIALLNTGDEIVYGDILNTNAQAIAKHLIENNIEVGMHLSVTDSQVAIKDALIFLLKHHDAVIITGGLGPTSDDRTRYALSAALKKPLMFDALSWESIVERIRKLTKATPPESNRQQALFPKGAEILPNEFGTANGCALYQQGKWIFMLPGPPRECIPMFKTNVLPILIDASFQAKRYRNHWLLFGASEGEIAEKLDKLVDPYGCATGYRLAYPYIEFKIHHTDQTQFENASYIVENAINPYLLGDGKELISTTLCKLLETIEKQIVINDKATGGALETLLHTPKTAKHVDFHHLQSDSLQICIQGLKEYWHEVADVKETTISISFKDANFDETISQTIPYRRNRTLQYAVEFLAYEIFSFLQKKRLGATFPPVVSRSAKSRLPEPAATPGGNKPKE